MNQRHIQTLILLPLSQSTCQAVLGMSDAGTDGSLHAPVLGGPREERESPLPAARSCLSSQTRQPHTSSGVDLSYPIVSSRVGGQMCAWTDAETLPQQGGRWGMFL